MNLGQSLITQVKAIQKEEDRIDLGNTGWKYLTDLFWDLAKTKEVRTQINMNRRSIQEKYSMTCDEIQKRCRDNGIACDILYDQPCCPIEGSKMQSVTGMAFSWEHA